MENKRRQGPPPREQNGPRGGDVIAGRNAVNEALKAGRPVDSLYVQRGEKSGGLSFSLPLCLFDSSLIL